MSKKKVLFLCTHNSARSQIAEGLLRALKRDSYEAYSAGVSPTIVDPDAIKAMAEVGIDITGQKSKGMDDVKGIIFDTVVTVCGSAKETCPFFHGAKEQIHRGFDDPAGYEGEERMPAFRRVRNEIKDWINERF